MTPRTALNMDILDHSEDEEEQSRYSSGRGSRFGVRRLKRRSSSHHQLLLMDCVGNGGGGNGDGASEETVPLPEYERLSQSARLPDDPDPALKNPPDQQVQAVKQRASPLQPQKPAAWRLIKYVRSRHKSGGAAGGCGSSDGDSKSSDGEKEGEVDFGKEGSKEGKKDNKKKRSSWLPDPDRRWPVQGFY